MSVFFWAATAVMAVALGVAGVLALATGRLLFPWLRRSVRRPGTWGAGALLMALSLAVGRWVPSGIHLPLMLGGLVLVLLAQTGRARGASPE
ncbi:hypothetical protein ACLIYM_23415 [Streptomyces fenghuangensis]|uniref:hypothetical protein n=1 Tax=Streptomyces sp. ICN903 TaxID=2964654 RepID=UPI001EDC4DF4|nr:hypothetical protein [Streptomyces sp. ICN903]MCG3042823.1 hypothetical protein [Streptomyces sp. ICN903]